MQKYPLIQHISLRISLVYIIIQMKCNEYWIFASRQTIVEDSDNLEDTVKEINEYASVLLSCGDEVKSMVNFNYVITRWLSSIKWHRWKSGEAWHIFSFQVKIQMSDFSERWEKLQENICTGEDASHRLVQQQQRQVRSYRYLFLTITTRNSWIPSQISKSDCKC